MIPKQIEQGEGRRKLAFPLFVLGLSLLAWTPSCGEAPNPTTSTENEGEQARRIQGSTMGTTWSASLYGASQEEDWEALLQAMLDEIEGALTTWNPESELMRFNASESVYPKTLDASEHLGRCVLSAIQATLATNGAFDPTLQPAVDLWGFGATRDRPIPSEEELAAVLQILGAKHLHASSLLTLDQSISWKIAKRISEVQVDLSAIAKGYAADRLFGLAYSGGCTGGLIEVGGEIRVFGARDGGGPWRVGVEEPASHPGAPKVIGTILGLDPDSQLSAVATSGDSRNRRTVGDFTFSHIIDPRTGRPLVDPPASVTVVAKDCATADAWATALLVLGPEEGLPLAEENGLEVCFQLRNEDGSYGEVATEGYEALVVERLNR